MIPKIFILCAFLITTSCAASQDNTRPNIIFILVDDMGWNDVGYNGMSDIPTPNIDALAADGVIISNFYTQPICTPSRAALLTGIYPSRLGLQNHVLLPFEARGLPLSVPTIANILDDMGYVNTLIGKWHLGFYKSEYLPTSRGFHSHFGSWGSKLDYYDHTEQRSEKVAHFINVPENYTDDRMKAKGHNLRCNLDIRKDLVGEFITDLLTDRAVKTISFHNTSRPLFLLFSHQALHRGNFQKPMIAPERFAKDFTHIEDDMRKNFSGFLTSVDESVGQVVSALFDKGILNNSIVIFASDNGADSNFVSKTGGSNWPLRGQKFTCWDGGLRVPALIWSPLLRTPGGRIWDGMMHITDWFHTIQRMAGAEHKKFSHSFNLWDSISENRPSPREETLLCSDSQAGVFAFRHGKFKLVQGSDSYGNFNGWYGNSGRNAKKTNSKHVKSAVENVLEKFHGSKKYKRIPLIVNIECGEKSSNPEYDCDLRNEVCLFDMEEDPCEYRNLAKTHPGVVVNLLNRLEEFKLLDMLPSEKKADFLANPSYYNDTWVPWGDTPEQRASAGPACKGYLDNPINISSRYYSEVSVCCCLALMFTLYIYIQ